MLIGKELEDLWFDDGFDGALARIAQRNNLPPDELKQSAFLEITESETLTRADCLRAARRVAYRMRQEALKESKILSRDELEEYGFNPQDGDTHDIRSFDGSRLSPQDQMISDLIEAFQPAATRDVYEGRLVVNGSPI